MMLLELFDSKSLYVCRPLLNVVDIKKWATAQGFSSVLDDLHVTITFSKRPVNWQNFEPQNNRLTVRGGHRCIKELGDKGAVVLAFPAKLLYQRWDAFCHGGASWDFHSYQPHLTISYQSDIDLDTIEPYGGDLIFGPEKFNVVTEDWREKIHEIPL